MFFVDDISTKKKKDLQLKVVDVKGDEVFKVPGMKINVSSYLKKNVNDTAMNTCVQIFPEGPCFLFSWGHSQKEDRWALG